MLQRVWLVLPARLLLCAGPGLDDVSLGPWSHGLRPGWPFALLVVPLVPCRVSLVAFVSLVPLGVAVSSGLVVELALEEDDEEGGLRFRAGAAVVIEGAALDFDVVCSGLPARVVALLFGPPLVFGWVSLSAANLLASATSSCSFRAAPPWAVLPRSTQSGDSLSCA